jgi:muramoyltetrapeptide carboxypeptidase
MANKLTKGKILCIEDLDEYLYHIDRMLQNLKRNGYFDELKGLIVGGMTKMHDNNISFGKNVKEIILDVVKEYEFPVIFDFPIGHIEDNRALVLGAEVSLEMHQDSITLKYM